MRKWSILSIGIEASYAPWAANFWCLCKAADNLTFIRLRVTQVPQKRQIQICLELFWNWWLLARLESPRFLDAWCEMNQTFILVKSNIWNISGTVELDWISRVCVPALWAFPKRCFGEGHFTMAGALQSCFGGSWLEAFKSLGNSKKHLKLACSPQSPETLEYIVIQMTLLGHWISHAVVLH